MCLEIDHRHGSCNNILQVENNHQITQTENITMEHENSEPIDLRLKINSLCGGSLIEHKPIFDPNGEIIYVVRDDKIRMYSIETGEVIRELVENVDGKIMGLYLDPENKISLISCTINGTILFWKLDSHIITQKLKIGIKSFASVQKFLVTSIDGKLFGVVHYYDDKNFSHIVLVDLSNGQVVHKYELSSIKQDFNIKVKFSDGNGFFAIIHKHFLYVIDKNTNEVTTHKNKCILNVVACHPEEQMIATGDVIGKVILWNCIFNKPVLTDFHWHHMIVLSIEFSLSGTVLYSGGAECVLVKWQIKEKTLGKNFLPRVSGSIKQISVDPIHDKITLSLDDNAIQIINSNLDQLKTIQDFTQISPFDIGVNQAFPAGIRVNPRNQYLVMNGRIGHLQFFSTKSMRLLFNIDITMKNSIPRRKNFNYFSTEVTHSAFSNCGTWMATVECWNDRINSIDLRLKFWKFNIQKQTYALHTQIEQPHESKIVSIEFSKSDNSVICATAGLDKAIKIWSLEASEEIENPKMIWMMIEQMSFKNLPVSSLAFSEDSSLLAAGFGNSLCLWDTTTFKLKCALSAPSMMDGSINRVILSLPVKEVKGSKNKKIVNNLSTVIEKRKKILQMMHSMIDDPESKSLIKDITKEKDRIFKQKPVEQVKAQQISIGEKKLIFNRVLNLPDLNLNEKLQVFHKLNIYYNISNHLEKEVVDFISRNATDEQKLYKNLQGNITEVRKVTKYKLLWRFNTWKMLDPRRNRKIVTVRKLLKQPIREEAIKMKTQQCEKSLLPIKNIASITNTIFCTNELSHLVVVTTPSRILIWNLMTLKIQGSFKIHAKHITLDPLTNLIAVFTKYNELCIIHPSPALINFRQNNMPNIHSAIWVPQDFPREQYLGLNWQASSRLLFLTHSQEICSLSMPGEDELSEFTPFISDVNEFTSTTPFAAMMSQKLTTDKTKAAIIKRISANTSGAVKEIINLSNHAMPPMSMICKDFISSLLTTERIPISEIRPQQEDKNMDEMTISDNEDEVVIMNTEQDERLIMRKAIEREEKLVKEQIEKRKKANVDLETEMIKLKLDEEIGNFFM